MRLKEGRQTVAVLLIARTCWPSNWPFVARDLQIAFVGPE